MSYASVIAIVLPAIAMLAPILVAAAIVSWDRRSDKRLSRRLPLSGRVTTSPGESLRRQIESIDGEVDSSLVALVAIGPVFIGCWALSKLEWSEVKLGSGEVVFTFCFVAAFLFTVRGLLRHVRRRRHYKEGLFAERYTAQELNRLMAHGCVVFHDVPADGFNIDHVVVGAGTVYAVETKSRRKPEGKEGHRVQYDGARLAFQDHVEVKPIQQAQRNATWLAAHLRDALGELVSVIPVVALPGWYIDTTKEAARATVKVVAVGGRSTAFMADVRSSTDPRFRSLISKAIALRYPTMDAES